MDWCTWQVTATPLVRARANTDNTVDTAAAPVNAYGVRLPRPSDLLEPVPMTPADHIGWGRQVNTIRTTYSDPSLNCLSRRRSAI
jgi:hypothetical protein